MCVTLFWRTETNQKAKSCPVSLILTSKIESKTGLKWLTGVSRASSSSDLPTRPIRSNEPKPPSKVFFFFSFCLNFPFTISPQ